MTKKIDYKTIRVLPYTVLALLLATLLIVVAFSVYSGMLINGTLTVHQITNGAYIVCYFIRYLSVVAIFICLYRLADLNRWIRLSCFMCISYMIAEMVSRVGKWMATVLDGHISIDIGALVVNIFPNLFVIMIIVFLLNAINDIYSRMGDNEKEKNRYITKGRSAKNLKPYWVIGVLFQTIISALLVPVIYLLEDGPAHLLAWCMVLGVIIMYVTVSTMLYLKINGFCYDFYIYNYNKGN
ncbi:MAG: hypothetical protein K6E10_10780 [Eubacterium sp.]|nr:hypothetical protein [Eubacterium sp.]